MKIFAEDSLMNSINTAITLVDSNLTKSLITPICVRCLRTCSRIDYDYAYDWTFLKGDEKKKKDDKKKK